MGAFKTARALGFVTQRGITYSIEMFLLTGVGFIFLDWCWCLQVFEAYTDNRDDEVEERQDNDVNTCVHP